tara:strand:- start:618 stop:1496 length:879 start_codon:yes stop_codon:yes gene_type:complete
MGGLPRSGSTLLSAILNQNPRFYSGPSSPVLGAMVSAHDNFMANELYHGYPKPYQVNEIVGSIMGHWYSDVDKPVIIDKNRAWTSRVSIIEGYLHLEPKIIVPVRRVDEILTSILKMIHRNPFKEGQSRINFVDEFLVKNNIPINDEERCNHLLNSSGIVYESLNAIMDGFKDQKRDKFHFIDYNDLVNDPQKELDSIYDFLGEEPFEHTFDGLSNEHREDDLNTYGLADMHEVHSELVKTSDYPSNVLPPSIIDLYNRNRQNLEFWTEPEVVKINPPKAPLTKPNTYNLFS